MTRHDDREAPRAQPRFKLFQPTTMVMDRALARVHLLDLSTHGARVHAADPPAAGQMVRLECAGRMRMARVAWADGPRFGVTFILPLSEDQVEDALVRQQAVVARHAARLGAVA